MGIMSDYYAAKDAERPDGSVDWDIVPRRNGGTLDTGHVEDIDPTAADKSVMAQYLDAKDSE